MAALEEARIFLWLRPSGLRFVRAAAWSRWDRNPSPPGRGELQDPLAHLAVGSCEVRLWEARNRSIVKLKEGLELLPPVQAHFTVKRIYFSLLALLPVLPLALNAQDKPAGSWSGVVVSSACNADEAFNESPECTKEVPGAKLALYDDTNRVMYSLEPQSAVSAHLGDTVTARGTLDGETLPIAAIESLPISLPLAHNPPPLPPPATPV